MRPTAWPTTSLSTAPHVSPGEAHLSYFSACSHLMPLPTEATGHDCDKLVLRNAAPVSHVQVVEEDA
jgi:hypothetical protein